MEERAKKHVQDLRPRNAVELYVADWAQRAEICALLGLLLTGIAPA